MMDTITYTFSVSLDDSQTELPIDVAVDITLSIPSGFSPSLDGIPIQEMRPDGEDTLLILDTVRLTDQNPDFALDISTVVNNRASGSGQTLQPVAIVEYESVPTNGRNYVRRLGLPSVYLPTLNIEMALRDTDDFIVMNGVETHHAAWRIVLSEIVGPPTDLTVEVSTQPVELLEASVEVVRSG